MFPRQQSLDRQYLMLMSVLVLFGLVMLSSAGAVIGYHKFGDSYFFFKRQVFFGIIPGIVLAYILSRTNYHVWRKFAFLLLLFSILLLLTVFIPGLGVEYSTGSRSWLNIAGFSFQPSELVKLTFLLYLAAWLEHRGERGVQNFSYGFLPFVVLLSVIMLLMILQPDIGTMSIIVFIALAVYFVAGGKLKHFLLLALAGAFVFVALVKTAPYRLARLTIFLHPELDPQGIGYHINQAFLAIGSGGWFGRGFGQSRQKFNFLPEVTGDSIFAIIAEELGFFLSLGFVSLVLFIGYRGFKIAWNAPDPFGKFVAAGITSWFLFQSFLNIGAMVGLFPITGVPLPFVSYGGTAMMVNLIAVGILLNISRYSRL